MTRMGKHPQPVMLIVAASAVVVAAAGGLSGCAADEQRDAAFNCVKKVNTNDPDDNVEVEAVDSQYCNEDGEYARSHGGGFFFISHGGYGPYPVGQRYNHSSSMFGGTPLIGSSNTAARSTASVPKSFSNGQVSSAGKVTVRGGGIGSGTSGGAGGAKGGGSAGG